EVGDQVVVHGALVEVELVDQAGAAAGLHRDAQAQVVAALLLEQGVHLLGGAGGEGDAMRGGGALGGGRGHEVLLETRLRQGYAPMPRNGGADVPGGRAAPHGGPLPRLRLTARRGRTRPAGSRGTRAGRRRRLPRRRPGCAPSSPW